LYTYIVSAYVHVQEGLAPILTTPTHWSREQLPPLQLKKEVCTGVHLRVLGSENDLEKKI